MQASKGLLTHTSLGTPIEIYSSRALAELKASAPILLMGGVHGDEPHGVHLAQKTLEFLLLNERKPTPEVKVPWILIPILNIDGYRQGVRVNGRGVDLNRNYPSRSWTASFEQERYNPGSGPGSEPEIQAVVKLIQETKPRLIIHCHSWNPMIVAAGPGAQRDAQRLSRSSGYDVVAEIGYPTPGSLSQYGWVDNGIPVICIEESDHTLEENVWPNFAQGMREIFLDASSR